MKWFFLLVLMCFSVSQSFAMEEIENNANDSIHSHTVHKINPGLYTSQQGTDLYFMMEKLDKNSRVLWQNYVKAQWEARELLEKRMDDILTGILIENDPALMKLSSIIKDASGLSAFGGMINENYHTNETREDSPTCETWVTYALHTEKVPEAPYTESNLSHVEMAFVALTEEQAPFTTHMGISRGLSYIQKHIEEAKNVNTQNQKIKFPIHSGISVSLHGFAGKVMKIHAPQKLYMITVPTEIMRNFIIKALPIDSIWLGHKNWLENEGMKHLLWHYLDPKAKKRAAYLPRVREIGSKNYSPVESNYPEYAHNLVENMPIDFTWTLRDRKDNIVLSLGFSKIDIIKKKYMWIFNNNMMSPSWILPYLIVDLEALSTEFDKKSKI